MKPSFSLDALMMFHEVVSVGSLTKASENLGLAKSTVSRQLTSLEKQIGAMLLKRSTRQVLPTEVGRQLYERCEKIVGSVGELDHLADLSRTTVGGTLRVSIPTEFGAGWLGKAIADFAAEYPQLRLEIEILAKPPNLLNDSHDVAIVFGTLRDSQLTGRRLTSLGQGMYSSPAYLALHAAPQTLQDLVEHEFIGHQTQQRDGVLSLKDSGRTRRLPVRHRIVVNSIRLARDLVVSGLGLAVLPHALCRSYVESGALVRVLPAWKCPPVQATAVVLARNGIPRKTRAFLDFVAERLRAEEDQR